jgi:hypothetical protein
MTPLAPIFFLGQISVMTVGVTSRHRDLIYLAPLCIYYIIVLVAECLHRGIRDNAVPFKGLMKFRLGVDRENKMRACLGCNAVPTGTGVVRVGILATFEHSII